MDSKIITFIAQKAVANYLDYGRYVADNTLLDEVLVEQGYSPENFSEEERKKIEERVDEVVNKIFNLLSAENFDELIH